MGQLLFCEAEVKELLTLPIVFWLSHCILSKIVDEEIIEPIERKFDSSASWCARLRE